MKTAATPDSAYQLSARITAVAGVFAVVVCALLFYDYHRRQPKDPLEDTTYKGLKAALLQQPNNDDLKAAIESRDLELRREYFRQRAFAAVGAVLLLGSVAVCLIAARSAATLRRQLPHPPAQIAPHDPEISRSRLARWAVASLAVVLVGVAVGLGLALRSDLPRPAGEPAPPAPEEREQDIAATWPRFRGPDGLGVSAYTNVPTTWNAASGENIAWKTAVPLPGNNSPVVWGNRVFLSGASETRREVYCFDAQQGALLWQKEVPGTPASTATPPKVMNYTGYAASTTAADGRRVFAIFANGDLAAFSFDGKLAWARSLGVPANSYGHASSLAMYKNLLLVQFDQGQARDKKSKFLALDAASGQTVWETAREVPNSWTTPIVIHAADRDQLITAADPWVIAYNPADGKEELWRARCLKMDVGPSPTFCNGIVYVANQFPCLSAIRADGKGDVTKTHVLWKGEDGLPDTCSPLATKQHVFLLASEGILTCYDAKKGDKLWEKDFEGVIFTSSPSLVGKLLYLVGNRDDVGKGWVVEPGQDDCKIVAESDLGEKCVTSPAFQDGRIYLRGEKNLLCIGKK